VGALEFTELYSQTEQNGSVLANTTLVMFAIGNKADIQLSPGNVRLYGVFLVKKFYVERRIFFIRQFLCSI
jgi:hypothetical protein